MEYKIISSTIRKAKIEITMSKKHGTKQNFKKMIDKGKTRAIHFSGHAVTAAEIKANTLKHRKT